MKIATCVYIIQGAYAQMANQQKTIIGFKGYGGKVKPGQTLRQNLVEEVWEETGGVPELRVDPEEEGGIHLREEWLTPIGSIDFYNGPEEEVPFEDPSFRVYFFLSKQKLGKAVDTIEMKDHQLFSIHHPPIDRMVKGDEVFVPKILLGIPVTGWIRRNADWSVHSMSLLEGKQCPSKSLNF
jgi:8-oxo-dGTP pyrophosphatase MutT (NUDIX family)